jgi:hypothetical protein
MKVVDFPIHLKTASVRFRPESHTREGSEDPEPAPGARATLAEHDVLAGQKAEGVALERRKEEVLADALMEAAARIMATGGVGEEDLRFLLQVGPHSIQPSLHHFVLSAYRHDDKCAPIRTDSVCSRFLTIGAAPSMPPPTFNNGNMGAAVCVLVIVLSYHLPWCARSSAQAVTLLMSLC